MLINKIMFNIKYNYINQNYKKFKTIIIKK